MEIKMSENRPLPMPQEIYRHFKGNLYQILTLATHTETGEALVIYQAMYGDFRVYARELSMFMSPVDRAKYPNVSAKYRFEKVQSQTSQPLIDTPPVSTLQAESLQTDKMKTENLQADGPKVEKTQADGPKAEKTQADGPKAEKTQADGPKAEKTQADKTKAENSQEESYALDAMLEKFLDADSYEEKMAILTALSHRITDEMLTIMSISCEIQLTGDSTQERYASLRSALAMHARFESTRIRG